MRWLTSHTAKQRRASSHWRDSAKQQLERALATNPEYYDAMHNLRALADDQPLRLTRRPFRADLVPVR